MALQNAPSPDRTEHPLEPLNSLRADTRPQPRHRLPVRQTSFVGRVMELAELAELLSAPDCRLLTIIGPGGIGKTRLALELAEAAQETFADGVVFVALRTARADETIATPLAEAIGCTLTGQGDVQDQVARFLGPKRLLVVMDNFEHLLEEAAWLGELLAAAPGLRMLVTSRAALNLREEWRYPIAGLATPAAQADSPDQYEAVRLFVERAQQVQHDFSLETQRDGVVRLCRITEGMPLALELAAAWVKALSCAAIADEIERNIAFLATDLRNVPARHRSMQAAFDHSWALLTESERHTFQRLAVFRRGFQREAAEQVAGATLSLLSSLVDKSLVRYGTSGRLYLHELLRQYAEEHLRADPEEAQRTYAAHIDYYLAFVAARLGPITGGAQREAIVEIAGELDNIRAAWRGAVAAGNVETFGRAAHALTLFYDFRARYREGLGLLEEGLQVLRAAAPPSQADGVLAALLIDVTRFRFRLMQLPAMRAALAEAEERYARLPGPPPPGHMTDPQVWRGILALLDGHYAEADRFAAQAVQRNAVGYRPGNVSPAWWVRAAAALWQEDSDAASEHARRAAETALAAGDRWNLAYCHNLQGHIAFARGDYAAARRLYEAAYAIREEFDDHEGMAGVLGPLARTAAREGDWDEAERLFRRTLAVAQDIGDLGILAWALDGLGMVACAAGDYAAGGRYFAEGLHRAVEARYMRLLLALLTSAGDWLLQIEWPAMAVETLALAVDHPASDHETRARARRLLATAAAVLPPDVYDAAVERGQAIDPADLAERLIPILTAPLPSVPVASQSSAPQGPPARTGLVEPLTERELAVLRLIAAGHSNREIAEELFLAVNTVRSYSQQIYGKLGVGSRTQAAARALDLGLLT